MLLKLTSNLLIFYLLLTIPFAGSHDLFDMFKDGKDEQVEKVNGKSANIPDNSQKKKSDGTGSSTHTIEFQTVLTAYRHLVKDWISKFPSKNAKKYRMLIELSSNQFDRLSQFSSRNNYETKDVLHEVHMISDILRRMVYKIEDESFHMDRGFNWWGWTQLFDVHVVLDVIVIIGTVVISYFSIKICIHCGHWFIAFIIVTSMVSFIKNWYTLFQEAQAKIDEILMKKLPKHCQGHSQGFFDAVKFYVGSIFYSQTNECLEYHKAMRVAPHSKVTPVQALSLTVTQGFVTPLGIIGESLSQFFAGTMRHVPIIVWPIVIILIVLIVIIILLMYSKYEIHLPFMMGSIRPSPHAAVRTQIVHAESIESSTSKSHDRIHQLEQEVQTLKLALEQQANLAIEHNATVSTRASRSISVRRSNEQRERSLSNAHRNFGEDDTNALRQRSSPPAIGFKKDFLPN